VWDTLAFICVSHIHGVIIAIRGEDGVAQLHLREDNMAIAVRRGDFSKNVGPDEGERRGGGGHCTNLPLHDSIEAHWSQHVRDQLADCSLLVCSATLVLGTAIALLDSCVRGVLWSKSWQVLGALVHPERCMHPCMVACVQGSVARISGCSP
jgi:hypothetical protein